MQSVRNKGILIFSSILLFLLLFHADKMVWIAVLGISIYVGVLSFLFTTYIKKTKISISKHEWKNLIIINLLTLIFIAFYSNNESFIPYWDSANYWKRTIEFNKYLNQSDSIKLIFQYLIDNINNAEYNLLPSLPLSSFITLLGTKFSTYIICVFLTYGIPSSLLFYLILKKYFNSSNTSLPLLIFLFFPGTLTPLLFGFVGSIGIIFILSIQLLLDTTYSEKFIWKKGLFISFMLVMLALSRRWFSFWIITFFISFPLSQIISLIGLEKEQWLKKGKIIIGNSIFIGVSSAIILTICFPIFVERTITNEFKDIYSAYQTGISNELRHLTKYYGYCILSLVFIGAYISYKRIELRTIGLFIFIQAILIFFLFIQVNDFGPQHYYMLNINLVLLILFGVIPFLSKFRFAPIFVLGIMGYLTFHTYIKPLNSFQGLFPLTTHYPRYKKDIEELKSLVHYVNNLTKDNNDRIYLLSSSKVMNDNMIKMINYPKTQKSIPNLVSTSHVDKRDGYPHHFFDCKYIITTDKAQTHLGSGQKVITYFHQEISNKSLLGKHYKPINTFNLEKGIKAIVLEKISTPKKADITRIQHFFKTEYPKYPQLSDFSPAFSSLISNIKTDKGPGKVKIINDNSVYLFPGNNQPSSFDIQTNNSKKISLTAHIRNPKEILKHCNPKRDGEVQFQIYGDDSIIYNKYITWENDQKLNLNINQFKTLKFVSTQGQNECYCDWLMLSDISLK